MQVLFLKLLELSLTGSLFALAVMLIRLLFRRAPRWIFCVLWGIVALRLLLPISIESSFSVVPESVASGEIISGVGDRYVGKVDVYYENNAGYSDAVDAGRQPIYSGEGYYVVTEQGSLEAPTTVGDTIFPVLSWIWFAGVAAMLAYLTISYLLLRRKMAEATLLRENIWQCEQVDSPFVLGFVKPRIYLPYAINNSDMANVIAHEQAHIRRRDHWWKPLGFVLLAVHWFNPVLWVAYILLCRDIEAACDEKVIRRMEKDQKRAYSTALLNCSVHHRRIAACPLAFGEVGVKERVKRVMNYKKPAVWIVILMIAVSVLVSALLLTNPTAENSLIRKIVKQKGYTIVEQQTETITLSLPVSSLPERIFSEEGIEFSEGEIIVYQDETATIYLKSAQFSNEGTDQLYFCFDFIFDLPKDGGKTIYPFKVEKNGLTDVVRVTDGSIRAENQVFDAAVSERGQGSFEKIWFYVSTEAIKKAEGLIGFDIQLNMLSYLKEGKNYEEVFDQANGEEKLLLLIDEIVNNPDCAASSNPFTFIEAKKAQYNEILTYGSTAVECFLKELRNGENGLRGYIMAVACGDITGIGDKDAGADWATAQEWLALYDKKASNIASIHSQIYAVKEVTYESGVYNFTIVAGENSPFYVLTEDMELASQKEVSEEGTWANLGKMEAIELSKENFDDLFKHPGNWADNADAKSIRDNTQKAWQLIYNQDVLYYILQQKNGNLYLAYGYTGYSNNDANAAHIRWLYKLSTERSASAGMVAASGHNAVPMISISKGTPIKDCLDAIHWLTINPFGDDLVPFNTAENGIVIYGKYSAYDAETFESLKHFMPSGLSPQTYLFQNADPEREYVVLADFGDKGNYAFGVRFGNENSALESLKRSVPEYFNLNHSKGLDVYVWQMANNHYSFGLMPHSETQRDWISEDLRNLKGITAEEMRLILSTYGIPQDEIYVIPWQNPFSSYIGEYWIITDGEDIEQKRNAYVQNLRDMLFSQQ